MASEYANEAGRQFATEGAEDASAGLCVPGKQSLASQQWVLPLDELVERVKARAGTELVDGGGYAYVVTPEGGFRIKQAPREKQVGAVITRTGPFAKAWTNLVALLDHTGDLQSVEAPKKEQAPKEQAPKEQAPAPQVEAQAPKEQAPKEQAPKEDAAPAAPIDTSSNDLFWVHTENATLKDERTGSKVKPEQVIPQFTHLRVLEKKPFKDFTGVKVAKLDGTVVGWANLLHMTPLLRPARPSTAAAQMAAVLAAARSVAGNKPHGLCYHNVKAHILGAGGYGDILDIDKDERFFGLLGHAVQFHAAVQKVGAAAVGLEEISGLPASAQPGTILLLRGTEKNHISPVSGDISVIDSVSGGLVHCLNDGHMKLYAKESEWSGEGHMANSFLAMYRPVDRQ